MVSADIYVTVTASQLRAYFDGEEFPEELETAFDSAQGNANIDQENKTILITVVPDKE
jgi:hypothetical protein